MKKKTLLILLALGLVLVVLTAVLLIALFSGPSAPETGEQPLEDYLAESWPLFRLHSWDPETGELELDYLLRFTYAQMEKYGGRLEELQELPAGNLVTVGDLKTAAREATGRSIRSVTVYGLTSDGQVAYTLHPDGTVETCWEIETQEP